jgi:hypothetical protein
MVKIFFADTDLLGSKLIRFLTWSDFSHVGFIDEETHTAIDSRYGKGGVTEYLAEELYAHYPRLIVLDVDVPRAALDFARLQFGKGYDLTALFGMELHRNWQEDDKWFCSELVAWCCAKAGKALINKEAWRVTPQDLWEVCAINVVKGRQND